MDNRGDKRSEIQDSEEYTLLKKKKKEAKKRKETYISYVKAYIPVSVLQYKVCYISVTRFLW